MTYLLKGPHAYVRDQSRKHHPVPGRPMRIAEADGRALSNAPHDAVRIGRERVRAADRNRRHLDMAQRLHALRR